MARKSGSGNVQGDVEIEEKCPECAKLACGSLDACPDCEGTDKVTNLYGLKIEFSWYRMDATHTDPEEGGIAITDMEVKRNNEVVRFDTLPEEIQDRLMESAEEMVREAEWQEA
jgi:hypothetical protein